MAYPPLTPDERVAIWAEYEADRDNIAPDDHQAYVDHLCRTLRARRLAVGFASDDLAATGKVGKVIAMVFFGWRTSHAVMRRQMFEGWPR